MANILANYSFDIALSYYLNGKTIDINYNRVKNIIIDKQYLKLNMPTVYLIMNVESPLYSNIIKNMEKGQFILSIKKFDSNNDNISKQKYIKYTFNYIIDIESSKLLDDDKLNEDDYHSVAVGLYLQSNVDNNKKTTINGIYKNCNTTSLVYYYCKHMKLVMEKFDNNRTFPLLIITPIDSISELLKFLNSMSSFYNTEYLFFIDFDYTYIISTKGNIIDVKDGSYNTINITIVDDDLPTNEQAVVINKSKKLYQLSVDKKNVDITKNKIIDNVVNKITGVSSDGFTASSKVSVNKNSGSGEKTNTIRVHNDNLTSIKEMQNTLQSKSTIITISKVGLDPSVYTPNKSYNIKCPSNTEFNGKYMLIAKKELFTLVKKEYSCITVLTLEKIS